MISFRFLFPCSSNYTEKISNKIEPLQKCWQESFWVELACHGPVLDGFDQPLSFLCTVHSLISAAVNKSQQHQIFKEKNSGTLRIKPGTAGWEAQTLPLCYAVPQCWQEFKLPV